MKKMFVSSALALALSCGVLVAEESGIFVGLGLGYGGVQLKGMESSDAHQFSPSGLSYEVLLGYKQFFTPNFGLRYYANLATAYTAKKIEGKNQKINVMNYGVNVDALYNFVTDDSLSFGAFLGLGLGANTWSGKAISEEEIGITDKLNKTSFNVALNVGLRTEIAKHHGIELAARVPFIATTLYDKDDIKLTVKQKYNVGLRYIFSF